METIGRYEVLHPIGAGGMAEVFLGRSTGEGGFEKLVAIKRMRSFLTSEQTFNEMFMDEARISGTLNHSNIGQVYDFGKSGDSYFIAMEYIPGLSLRAINDYFKRNSVLPHPPLAAYVLKNICAGLEYAHTKCDAKGEPLEIVHRDVSPPNVLISFGGDVKLIDFGVAKASDRIQEETDGGGLKGKVAYMSPEQAGSQPIDNRADIFSAGIVLYELLTGDNPFKGDNLVETAALIQKAELPDPDPELRGNTPGLFEICERSMARRPEDRYSSAGDMQEALEAFLREHPYGSRQLAKWMTKAFPEEQERLKQVLLEVKEKQPDSRHSTLEILTSMLTEQDTDGPPPSADQDSPPLKELVVAPPGPSEPTHDAPRTGPGPTWVLPTQKRRSNRGLHVVVIGLVVAVLAVGAYLLVVRSSSPTPPAAPVAVNKAPLGTVAITVEPPIAGEIYVFVDGKMHGELTAGEVYRVEDLLAGKHRIQIKGGPVVPVETIVEVVEGQTTPLRLAVKTK